MFCETLLADVKFGFWLVLHCLFYDVGVLEGPTGSIVCILYCFYICFAKTYVRVCGRFPVFENLLFYGVFLMISSFVDFICVL